MSLSLHERTGASQVIPEQAEGRVPCIVGVTAANKFEAAAYAAHAKSIGASAVLTLPQTDYQATDPLIFAEYLAAIAEASGLPIIVQTSYPGLGGALPPDFLIHLSKEIPLLRYVKGSKLVLARCRGGSVGTPKGLRGACGRLPARAPAT